jgi:hypothetical protein
MLQQVLEAVALLDSARVTGHQVAELLRQRGVSTVGVQTVQGARGTTDFIEVLIAGYEGRTAGGKAPTLGIIGRLGGIGARPTMRGIVSDADGAVTAVAAALKLADMQARGDQLPGDVIITTHICPNAPTQPHDPVPFMGSPVDMQTMNRMEVRPECDAILSVDTTRGNRVINHRGFAISPTVKEGYILRVSDDLVSVMEVVTGQPGRVFPVTVQDITPYGNGVYHINSILQPATATPVPVVGVALTAGAAVPGCATGAIQEVDIEQAARFCIEVANRFGEGKCAFYDPAESARLEERYGSMRHLQTMGQVASSVS